MNPEDFVEGMFYRSHHNNSRKWKVVHLTKYYVDFLSHRLDGTVANARPIRKRKSDAATFMYPEQKGHPTIWDA